MSTVRISKKSARALSDFFANTHVRDRLLDPAIIELRAALTPRKPKPLAVASREARVSRRAAKGYETDEIRRQVLERAGGACEVPGCYIIFSTLNPGELDHFHGRGKAKQSVENCWQICRGDHRNKTNNRPSAAWWLERFIAHAERHGYRAEAERARARLEGIVTVREQAAEVSGVRR